MPRFFYGTAWQEELTALALEAGFTAIDTANQRKHYDPKAPPAAQVEQSFNRSLEHLGTNRLDSYNVSLAHLRTLCDEAGVLPAFVQNRCYARTGWDREVRLCAKTTASSTRAFRCSPPTAPSWPAQRYARSPTGSAPPFRRSSSGSPSPSA